MSQDAKSEFALFIDESGSPKPNPDDPATYFALGGVLVKRADEKVIEDRVKEFKQRWDIDENTPLHGNEIRSKKKRFAWLGKLSDADRSRFMEDLTNTISSLPIIVHACVVSRQGYLDRYLGQYGEDTWEMMKSAFSILVDRVAKYIADEGESIMIYYEKAGKREDDLIEGYFKEIRQTGHPFDSNNSSKYSPLDENELSKYLKSTTALIIFLKTTKPPEQRLLYCGSHTTTPGLCPPPIIIFTAKNVNRRSIKNYCACSTYFA